MNKKLQKILNDKYQLVTITKPYDPKVEEGSLEGKLISIPAGTMYLSVIEFKSLKQPNNRLLKYGFYYNKASKNRCPIPIVHEVRGLNALPNSVLIQNELTKIEELKTFKHHNGKPNFRRSLYLLNVDVEVLVVKTFKVNDCEKNDAIGYSGFFIKVDGKTIKESVQSKHTAWLEGLPTLTEYKELEKSAAAQSKNKSTPLYPTFGQLSAENQKSIAQRNTSYINKLKDQATNSPAKTSESRSLNGDTDIPVLKRDVHSQLDNKDESQFYHKAMVNNELTKEQFVWFMMQRVMDNKTNKHTRDRILTLIAKEIGKPNLTRADVVAIVEEKMGTVKKEIQVENPEGSDSSTDWFAKAYLVPSNLYKFLKSYNDDEILKGTCHLVDSGELQTINRICETETYDYQKHYQKIIEHFNRLENSYNKKFIDNKFLALIYTYINGPKKWNSNICINWGSSELKEWTKKHPGIPPNLDPSLIEEYENIGFEFKNFKPKFKLLESNYIQTFGELTQYFKYLFHIRSDNSIGKICSPLNKKNGWDAKISFNYEGINEAIELFTNVEKLIETYEKLIELILEVTKKNKLPKPEVALSFINEGKDVKFCIWHKNTTYKHTLQDTIERLGQSYKNLINNQLNGLCEFNIEANFGAEGSHNISVWNFEVWKNKKATSKTIDNMEGVKYILTFKK